MTNTEMTVLPSADRGHANHGWFNAKHTFSFASYHSPEWHHFRSLRVINQDIVRAGTVFDTHPHSDMEIISLVLRGKIEHRDSMGQREILKPGQVQVMTAGTGIEHSERNPSSTEELELMQIWIMPKARGLKPDYETKDFSQEFSKPGIVEIVSPDGRNGSLVINQDARLYHVNQLAGSVLELPVPTGRYAWVQILSGTAELAGEKLGAGDGVKLTVQSALELTAGSTGTRALIFDLA